MPGAAFLEVGLKCCAIGVGLPDRRFRWGTIASRWVWQVISFSTAPPYGFSDCPATVSRQISGLLA
jgi:hypothetical protein